LDAFDLLPSIAEIAVALLGFAAIVSVFQERGESADGRFWSMLQFAFATLTFALLPLPLLVSGVAEPTIWAASSAAFAAFVTYLPILAARSRQRDQAAGRPANVSIFILVFGGSLLSLPLLVYNVVELRVFWPYLATLVWFSLATALIFLRMLQAWLGRG
jgi:phosphatidylglycerophosphate synthase